ncbi:MAG TPA: glycosyltransferase family 2 protein [Pyrinomonadaceae bacterium]|nr:glycosyltransferase family 2 protein [Pyrinomonadaceae bacterium]
MNLSIVSTLYQSAVHLEEFHKRVRAAAEDITSNFEIILVNDGSPDDSLDTALSLCRKDRRVRVIDLSRNFGQHKAIMTGLAHARGELVFLLDDDLEEAPELLKTFYESLQSNEADVIFGVQRQRRGGLFERVSGFAFFALFNSLSTHPIPKNIVTARLMTRRYVSALLQYQEREMLIAGLWTLTGFKQLPVVVNKAHRNNSSYRISQKFGHFVNAITSYSSRPLVLIFYLGCLILLGSTIAAIDLIVRKLFFGSLLQGWSSLIVSIWLLGGLNIFCLGVIGIYLSKIFIEVKQRPYTIIRQVYEHEN